MTKKLYTLITCIVVTILSQASVFSQCVTNVSATLNYVSNSGGNCTYNFTPSALINSTPDVKLVQFTLPAGSTPSTVCYAGNPIANVPCTGGYSAINNNSTVVALPTVSVTIPCTAGNVTWRASTATSGNSTCASGTATVTGANPVKLSFFRGFSQDNQVYLQWQTEAETNSSYFMVQRSVDAKEFGDLEIIQSVGESTQKVNYEYIDKNPSKGINYYRLRQVDNDGSFLYSRIIDIQQDGASDLIAFPNPSVGNLTLKGLDEVVSCEAFAVNGTKADVQLEKTGNNYRVVFAENQAKGTYLLKLKTKNKSYNYRLVLE